MKRNHIKIPSFCLLKLGAYDKNVVDLILIRKRFVLSSFNQQHDREH